MGTIMYGSAQRRITLDDRTLAHVKAVLVMKLRRQESFTLSWRLDDVSGGRTSLWIHPSIPLEFQFEEAERPELNREWLEALMAGANKTGDLRVEPEPVPEKA